MGQDVSIAVVGCGYWGPNLIRNFLSLRGCKVGKVCDKDPEQLARMKRMYPDLQVTRNFGELVEDVELDALAIATPVNTHFPLAREALLSGKHLFIEKPIASSTRECQELIGIAKREGRVLMVDHTFLFSVPVRKIKEIVDSGELGELLYISSQRLNLGLFQKDINVAWDLAPHDLSILLYIMGSPPVSVNCQGKSHVTPGVEDVITMCLEFPNGGFATILNSWLDPNKVRRMTFVGSKKMLLYDDLEPLEKIKIYDKRVEVPPKYDTFGEFQYSYHYGDIYVPYLNQTEPLRAQCQHFLDCILNGSQPQTGGLEGLRVVEILEAGTYSLRNGGARIHLGAAAGGP